MKRPAPILRLRHGLAALVGVAVFGLRAAQPAAQPAALTQLQAIPLPEAKGRFDHFAIDTAGQRLFVAALGNNTVEIIDLKAGRRAGSLAGCNKPQGVAFVPKGNLLIVANGGDGRLRFHDAATLKPIVTLGSLEDADNLRVDARAERVYVGYGAGALGLVNPATGVLTGTVKLLGHPESFQLEQDGPRIFVNVPDARHVAVIDRQTREVAEAWLLPGAGGNFPMALDEAGHRLFVGCRTPPRLIVLDTATGAAAGHVEISGDTDDLFYDRVRKRIYISCGAGGVDVIEQKDADHYAALEKIPTAPGARTSFYSPELDRFYLAVPQRGSQPAEIRVYRPGE